ncbi:MAG: hypothetical protein LBB73_07730 [Dysgonamonadaceae bacterium]|jgi:hypothetical protein|nr:hypothetical protein [Dysgonamonadaceae bacterium]
METLLQSLVEHLLPKEISLYFGLTSIEEKSHGIELRMEEYAGLLPLALREAEETVLDGFCNPLELLHFSMKGKPLYLKLYRRRWKEPGSEKHYSNRYDLHPEGVKATHEFASFLKDEVGCTADEYIRFLLDT